MRRVRAPPDAPVDAEHSSIGIHQGQRIELKPGCAREHGQHAEHSSRLVGDRRRHSKHAEPVGRREQPITLPQRIPADGFEDELDRRSAWACPRFKVHSPVVDHVINGGPLPKSRSAVWLLIRRGAIDRLRSNASIELTFPPSRPPGSDDRVPEERSKKSNHNNAKDKAPRVATKGRVGGQPVGIAHAKLLGRPPASQPRQTLIKIS
jgi:hypothetical protein